MPIQTEVAFNFDQLYGGIVGKICELPRPERSCESNCEEVKMGAVQELEFLI